MYESGLIKNGGYPVKNRITKKRLTDYVGSGIFCSKEEWVSLFKQKLPLHLQDKKDGIDKTEQKVRLLLASLVCYNIKVLRKLFKEPEPEIKQSEPLHLSTNIFDWFEVRKGAHFLTTIPDVMSRVFLPSGIFY